MRRDGIARYRTPLALSALVLAGAGFIWWDRAAATTDELEARRQNVFRAFHRERVDRVEVTHATGGYELRKQGDNWFVVSHGQRRPADVIEAERLLSEIEGAEASRALGALDATSRQRFGLDHPRATVVLHEGAEVTARFALGGTVQGEDAVYVEASAALGGGDAATHAVVLPRSFGQPFDRAAVEFRDRKVAEIDGARIERLEVTVDGDRRVLEQRGPVWQITTPALGRASRGAVETVTSELRDLRATRVIADDASAETLARLGLDAPAVRLDVRRAAGVEPVVLRLGRACPEHDDEVAATREGTGTVVCFGRSFVNGLRAPAEGFRDDHVLAARTDEVSEVRIKGAGVGGADLVLRRGAAEGGADAGGGDTTWRAESSPWPVDAEAVESWLTTLHDVSTPQRLAGDQRAARGLGAAATVIEVRRTGVDGAERILVGASDAEGLYVSRDDEPVVLQFAPSLADTLRVEAIRFRSPHVIRDAEDDLRALILEAGPLREEMARVDGALRLTSPVAVAADPGLASELAHGLASLDAERWVSATARPEHGLAQPRARVVARFEGNGAREEGSDAGVARVRNYLVVAGANAPGGGVYASLDGSQGVFVMPRAVFEALTAPHVDRGALRIARDGVTRVTITVNGPAPRRVALVRSGDDWRTDTGTPADAARVDTLLNHLANATSSRVFGYGPPPPEARLAAPSVVVEVQGDGDAGRQSARLVVGARFGEGEGAGFYARRDGLDVTMSLPAAAVEAMQQFQP